jgi:hypothetical protein
VKTSLTTKGKAMDLDELLDRSTPPTAPRGATLQHELQRMVVNAEAAVRPRRRNLKHALVSAMAAGVFSAGTAGAMAAGIVPTPSWIPWATDAGSSCEMQFTASAAGPDGQALSRPYAQAEKQRAVTEATRFLAAFDYSSINEADAIRDWKQEANAAIAREVDPNERQPRLTGDDLALTAVGRAVWNQLSADLTAHHIPTEIVVFAQAWRCE